MDLAYKFWPSPAQKPGRILLLHGMGGTGALWRPLAVLLEDKFECLAPDQRGHGGSQIPHVAGARLRPGFAPLDYGQDIVELLDSKNFHPCWVVGHSMGVRSACAVAHLRPDFVQGLILVDLGLSGLAGGGLGEGLAGFLRNLPAGFSDRLQARDYLQANCPDPSIGQYLMAVALSDSQRRLSFPFDRAALIETIYAARDSAVRTWVLERASEGMRVLLLRGEKSLVWSREEFEREKSLFKDYPSVLLEEFPGAGHGLPFEKRQEFANRIRQFTA